MKICLLGLDNLPALASEYRAHPIGGESVQQTLLARALQRRGHEVSMVTVDHGQREGEARAGIRIHAAYRPAAGIPVLRFLHPRWTGLWSALARADAQVYYTSCAGMQLGLLALFCARHSRRLVFRCASDADCDPRRLLIRHRRDRWLYRYGLRRSDAILVQSVEQARSLEKHYGRAGQVAGMLVEAAQEEPRHDVDVLWVSNIRRLKRPDRVFALAAQLPRATFHMIGGSLPHEEALYERVRREALRHPNVTFHGRMSYWDAAGMYGRGRLLVNTSDVEGFPNAFLQAWIHGVPVVSYADPDGLIRRHGLGAAVSSPLEMRQATAQLLGDPAALAAASARCRAYMAREFGEEKILAPYLAAFEELVRATPGAPRGLATSEAPRV